MTGYPAPVVTWRKLSGPLPQGRVKYNNSALQILHVRKDDSDVYFCAASNLLGSVEKKTLLVVVSPPRFTVKPPAKVFPRVGSTLMLQCRATGDPQPVISWKKQDGQLPAGRSRQLINGTLVIRVITINDRGIYKCIAPYARVLKTEAVTYIGVQKGILCDNTVSYTFLFLLAKRPRKFDNLFNFSLICSLYKLPFACCVFHSTAKCLAKLRICCYNNRQIFYILSFRRA